jgi:hypothetical protein
MLPSEIKKMMIASGVNASMQQQQLVSHWKDMSSRSGNSKKRRRAAETHQPARIKSKIEDASHTTVAGSGKRETQQTPATSQNVHIS